MLSIGVNITVTTNPPPFNMYLVIIKCIIFLFFRTDLAIMSVKVQLRVYVFWLNLCNLTYGTLSDVWQIAPETPCIYTYTHTPNFY
jgi:hypothetical protein